MPNFEVEFVDGTKHVIDTATADQAKQRARQKQRETVPADTPASAAEVKVKRVTALDDKPAGDEPETRNSRSRK